MFSTRPNLYTLMLAALAIPIGLFALFAAISNHAGSSVAVLLAAFVALLLLAAALPTAYVLLAHALRRLRRPHPDYEFGIEPPTCPHCGYDLRASPDHCPECGRPVPPLDRTIIQYLIRLRRKG
jgi:predicted Zn-ribbon and HTH transcriptional regulator